MKLNRKVASVLLAVTMFAGVLSVPAMADENNTDNTGETTPSVTQLQVNDADTTAKTQVVNFTKSLSMTNAEGASIPNVTFNFNVVPTTGDGTNGPTNSVKDTNNTADGVTSATIESTATKDGDTVSTTVPVTFDLSKFSKPGEYTYTLTEVGCTDADVAIDNTSYTMTVCVVNVLDTNKNPTGSYTIQWATLSKTVNDATTKVNSISNTYNTYDLTVSKTVTGNMGDKNQKFKFTITFKTAVSNAGKSFSYAVGNADATTGSFNVPTADGSDTSKATASVTVDLAHNESVSIQGLPSDVEYTIEETNNDGYTVSYAGAVQDEKNASKATGAIKVTETNDENVETETAADRTVTVTNNKEAATATGLLMDVAPYAAMILLAAAAAFVFLRRRNSNED